jgi:teichuronic acid biosynthesis glycosyltransferase TuaC
MRILFFSTAFPQPTDPVRAVYNLERCRALAERHEVAVISPCRWTDRFPRYGSKSRQVDADIGCFVDVRYPTFIYPRGLLHQQHHHWLWWSCRHDVAAVLAAFKPHAVLSYWTFPDGAVASRIARAAGVPLVAVTGGSDVLIAAKEPARREQTRSVLVGADAVIATSSNARRRVIELGVHPADVTTLPLSVDTVRFCQGDRQVARQRLRLHADIPMLLWVGRVEPVKNPEALIDACAVLKRQGRDFSVCMIGDGTLRSSVAARIDALDLNDRIRLIGSVPPTRLPDWYRAADATVLTSVSEGMPNVLLESIACGTPFVATNVGDVLRIADEAMDTIVADGDCTALANALATVLDRPFAGRDERRVRPGPWSDCARVIERVLHAVRNSNRVDHLLRASM